MQAKPGKFQFAYVEIVVHSFYAHQQPKIISTGSQVHYRYYNESQLMQISNPQNTLTGYCWWKAVWEKYLLKNNDKLDWPISITVP